MQIRAELAEMKKILPAISVGIFVSLFIKRYFRKKKIEQEQIFKFQQSRLKQPKRNLQI